MFITNRGIYSYIYTFPHLLEISRKIFPETSRNMLSKFHPCEIDIKNTLVPILSSLNCHHLILQFVQIAPIFETDFLPQTLPA